MKHLIRFLIRNIPRPILQRFSKVGLKLFSLFYKGNKVECPVCTHTFRKFLPYGYVVARENALCPNCQALERHRVIWLFLQKHTSFFTEKHKMLHVAPEDCFMHRFKALKNLEYISGDIESPLAMVKMDVHDIPFEANTFDVVFCNHVLEHVEDDVAVLKEFVRVLKPGGWAILQSPIDASYATTYEDATLTTAQQREAAFGQYDHVRMFGRDYHERLALGGFEVKIFDLVSELGPQMADRYKIPATEKIYYCSKPVTGA